MRRSLFVGFAVLCLSLFACADESDDSEPGGPVPSGEEGDPNESLEDQLARIAQDESDHSALAAKADGVLAGFEAAADVTKGVIVIADDVPVPSYQRARGDHGFSLGGTEFWQKWSGGHNPTYSYGDGTEAGRKCMQASAIRFQALMADLPATYVYARENTNWGGSHFNWNDDYSHEDASGSPRGATLWAWRTGLMKFISQTGKNGKCYLVTRAQVEAAGMVCAIRAEGADGETKGCSVRASEIDGVLSRYADRIAEINGPGTDEPVEPDPDATRYEGEAGVEIPDNDEAGATSTAVVDAEGTVSAVTIHVEITHPYIGDLTVTLTHGDVVEKLHASSGGSDDDLTLNVSRDSFAGTDKKGDWVLTVIDGAAQDTGTIKAFAVSL